MPKRSAGLLLYRIRSGQLEVLLVDPGGPFFVRKDAGAWSIPKGESAEGEDPQTVSLREFEEETGVRPDGNPFVLGEVRQAGGKIVTASSLEGDLDPGRIRSNTFEMEWPPRSGHLQSFPEVDKAAWFSTDEARSKILVGQAPLLGRLREARGQAKIKQQGSALIAKARAAAALRRDLSLSALPRSSVYSAHPSLVKIRQVETLGLPITYGTRPCLGSIDQSARTSCGNESRTWAT